MTQEAKIKPWLRPAPKKYAFVNANVVDAVSGSVHPFMTVKVENGKITYVWRTCSADICATSDLTIVDCAGQYLCPGLIDSHVHLIAVPGLNDLAAALNSPPAVSLLRQPYVCAQMLHRGFTTVRDCGGAQSALKDAIEDGVFIGPRLFIAGHALSQSGGHADYRGRHDHSACCGGATNEVGRICNGVPQCMQAVREEIRTGSDFIKIMGSGGVSSPTDKIEHLQFSAEEIRAMVTCATNAGTYVTAHAYTVDAIRQCVDNGVRGIEHGNLLDKPTAELMATKGVYLTPTLVTYETMASLDWAGFLPPESQKKNTEVLEAGLRALKMASEAGVTICFGTDLLGPLGSSQTREFAIRAEILSNLEVLRSATVNAARLLRQEKALGQIREGFEADMLLLTGNPLKDVTILDDPEKHIEIIMKEGRVYKSRSGAVPEDAVQPLRIKPVP